MESDAAVKAHHRLVVLVEGLAEFEAADSLLVTGGGEGLELLLDSLEPTKLPIASDGGVEMELLFGISREEAVVVFVAERSWQTVDVYW